MNGLGRLLNEVSVALTREYLPFGTRLRVVVSYYLFCLRCRFAGKGGTVRFLGFSLYSPSLTNLVTIVREVFMFGDYYFKAASEAPTIIDCGGNIGISTIFFKWLYPSARITVWEPAPQNIEALKRNIERNKLTDITVVEAAAAQDEGTVTFWQSESRPGSSTMMNAVHEAKSNTGKHQFLSYDVATKRLSSSITGTVDLLKMDIEGAEGNVFRELAASGAIAHIRDTILEYHDNQNNESNGLPELLQLFATNGLQARIFNNEITESSESLKRQPAHHFLIRAFRSEA